jgi:hypothetical protein
MSFNKQKDRQFESIRLLIHYLKETNINQAIKLDTIHENFKRELNNTNDDDSTPYKTVQQELKKIVGDILYNEAANKVRTIMKS